LTGLWQVSGKNKTTFSEMIYLDIKYAATKSLWLDLKIMLLTAPTLLQQVIETRMSRKSAPVATSDASHIFSQKESQGTRVSRAQLSAV